MRNEEKQLQFVYAFYISNCVYAFFVLLLE